MRAGIDQGIEEDKICVIQWRWALRYGGEGLWQLVCQKSGDKISGLDLEEGKESEDL